MGLVAGYRLAGNLDRWPGAAEASGSWFADTVRRDGIEVPARLHRVPLDQGHRLLVGRDATDREKLRSLLSEALLWSFAVAVAFALAGAAALRRALVDRLRAASATAGAIAAGDLTRRVPLSTQRDEFDQLGESMNAMLDRIDQLMIGIKGVSDSIAHDLRTPLTSLRNDIEGLRQQPISPEAADALLQEADRILAIFNSLLRITNITHGKHNQSLKSLDLSALLLDGIDLYEPVAEERKITLHCDLAVSGPIAGDSNLLFQLFANLLDNAVKFASASGAVHICLESSDDAVTVLVMDNGPGIPEHEKAHVFRHFYRGDNSRRSPGHGLGLSLAKAIVEYHGAQIALEDANPGLRVRVVFNPYQEFRIG
jgi:signal transduction histidine kinase